MIYRQLGKSGLRVSELSFGSWITFGESLDVDAVRQCLRVAWDHGVNFFDNAEVYANGVAETLMGEALKDYRREDLVISTKIFWGGEGPNDEGLSRKHLIEGTRNSLKRLQLDYVDLLFCHRPDPHTPIEETVRAMDFIVNQGMALYWGTSEWSADQIKQAHTIASAINAVPPTMEQPEYNIGHRDRVEKEYASLYSDYGMGLTTWSPLESGILSGKYNQGIPEGSRLARHRELSGRLTRDRLPMLQQLGQFAKDLGCTQSQIAIAWCLLNPHVSSVITGASTLAQIHENMGAAQVKDKLKGDVLLRLEEIIKVSF